MTKKNDLAIIILAAGKGTRMGGDKPKVMHELCGLPMINWLIKTAENLNPAKIVVVVGPDMPELEEAVSPHTTTIQTERNGTGGAAKVGINALGSFDGDVLILLGDAPLMRQTTLENLITARNTNTPAPIGLSLLGCNVHNPHGYGRVVLDNTPNPSSTPSPSDIQYVKSIVEEKDASPEEKSITLINTGAFCVDGKHLAKWLDQITNDNAQGEFYITDLPKIAAKEGFKTTCAITNDETEIAGCNTRLELTELEKTARTRLVENAINSGVKIIDPATTYLSHDTQIGEGTIIEPNVVLTGNTKIGKNTTIKSFSHIEDSTIGDNTTIGPFARLRGGASLDGDNKIGNFVELKNAKLAKGVKASHLSYLGDAELGDNTNIGAGTITCNYNGFEKNKTIIGKNVFVGSNSSLVAPIKIEDGAMIAAGSTINKDVEKDALAITRAPLKILGGWAKKFRAKYQK